jgi:hypothetical protein
MNKSKAPRLFHSRHSLLICLQCSGERPSCDKCVSRGSVCCYTETEARQVRRKYEDLRNKRNAYEELFELLKALPEQETTEVLRRIKAGVDVATLVNHAKDGDLLIQLSLVPEIRRLFEFPYISGYPSYLFVPDNTYLNSWLYRAASSHPTSHDGLSDRTKDTRVSADDGRSLQNSIAHNPSSQHPKEEPKSPFEYQIPFHAAQMVEPIIEHITATGWTSVISDNQLLRRLLYAYFFYPQTHSPMVHKDLFLRDMAAKRNRFCTPLLVNAVLACASVGSR